MTAAKSKTAAAKTIEPAPVETLPAAWGTETEVLETRVVIDKDTILGMPFKVLGFEIERNATRQYDTVFVYAIDANGEEFTFADSSSTGVLKQIQDAAIDRNVSPTPDAGYQAMPVIVMGGLRVSEFDRADGSQGRTFYLQGKRRGSAQN